MLPEGPIMRKQLFPEYLEMMSEYISRVTGDPKSVVQEWLKSHCQSRYKGKRVKHIKTVKTGVTRLVEEDLGNIVERTRDKIITPSGSVYYPANQKMSFISQMMADKLAERKKVKSKMLDAKGRGDFDGAQFFHYQQANIKINTNALTGGLASPFNILYDKGGYNGITSSARSMITRVNTIAEQLLGGNFAWFKIDELINHIILNVRIRPSDEQIMHMVQKYNLHVPTKEMLKDFYTKTIKYYLPTADCTSIHNLVDTLSVPETTFLWYYCNLVHLFQGNEFFRKFVNDSMDISNVVPVEGVTPKEGWKLDGTLVAISAVTFSEQLGGFNQKQICEEHNEYLGKLVAYTNFIGEKMHSLDDLFETFVWTDADIPEVKSKPAMRRNIVVVSDTDSTIFTTESWQKFLWPDQEGLDTKSYHIASLCIYWLHHTVVHALKRFSTYFGVAPEQRSRLAMKNEFLYPVMLIYPLKKTYASVCAIQEGTLLYPPQPDIKGAQLRSSAIPKSAVKFVESLLINEILTPAMTGKVSANHLIDVTVSFEQHIIQSLKEGNKEFLNTSSLGMVHDYKNPDRTPIIRAHRFWQQIFSKKYGEVTPPLKVSVFPTVQPTSDYLDWLKKESPDIYRGLVKYLEHNAGEIPNNLLINPGCETVPNELRPLINIRSLVYAAMKPTYMTLSCLKIAVGNDKLKMLLSDIYGPEQNQLALGDEEDE